MIKAFSKKCIAWALALILIASMVPAAAAEKEPPTEDTFGQMIHAFREEFPHGKYWNDANGTVDSGRYRGSSLVGDRICTGYGCGSLAIEGKEWAWQCDGYAKLLTDRVFESFYNIDYDHWERTDYTLGSFDGELYAGDLVRAIMSRGTAHSIFVYKVTDEAIYYTDCNRGGTCRINWGIEEPETFKSRISFVLHYEGNTLKGTKTVAPQLAINYHANGGSIPGSDQTVERYRILTAAGMNLRAEPSLSAKKVGLLEPGAEFSVTETAEGDGYLWGKVSEQEGWCAISEKNWVECFETAATEYFIDEEGIISKTATNAAACSIRALGIPYAEGLEEASAFGLSKEGASFLGWSADPQGLEVIASKDFLAESICPALADGDQKITLYAVWKDLRSEMPFSDVSADKWYYEGVDYTFKKGWMNGTAETTFAPQNQTTRAMLVTVLYRIEGSPAPSGESGFTDVAAEKWYTDAVTWAAENRIVNGIGNGLFAPDKAITRAQMAAIFFRYAQYKQRDEGTRALLDAFTDQAELPAWAAEGMQWAVSKGIISGVKAGETLLLQPQGNATRAQIATVLMRYDKEILQKEISQPAG